ncbi:HofP DNA utilization family protein [Buttiauxella gaviniae]|uniref:HofP DNA utilization family protein n=1 Tax=Buttiauxella gaviniae TaxID=82990 RepID=A0ABV3NSX1_9ENTR
MNRSLCWGFFIAMAPVWAMPPNPFQPQISPCEKLTGQLSTWVLQGVISSPRTNTALMLSPQGAWRRMKVDMELIPGAKIESIGTGFVNARLELACQPSSYRWELKGKTYAMDSGITSDSGSAIRKPGESDKSGR